MRRKYSYIAITALILAALACAGPGAATTPDATATFAAALTAAFGTAQANNPPVASATQGNGVTTLPPTPTQFVAEATQSKPSDTPAPTNTPGTQGCSDGAQYVTDVTIPDDTVLQPGQAFTKTWRIKNSGTCTWTGSYQFAFVGGAQMNAAAAVPINGSVTANTLYDVSVNMVAPTAPGTYKGSWQMKNSAGQLFGSVPFVQIVVPAPTATNTPVTPTATFTVTSTVTNTPTATNTLPPAVGAAAITVTNNGQVNSDGSVNAGVNNAGDTGDNKGLQAFITFSLAGIPSNATIVAVRLDLSSYDYLPLGGVSPFDVLGCLRGYKQDYGSLDSADYFSGSPSGALWRFCNLTELSNTSTQSLDTAGLAVFQAALPSGNFQVRLQFNEKTSNNDGVANALRPTPKLIVSYTTP